MIKQHNYFLHVMDKYKNLISHSKTSVADPKQFDTDPDPTFYVVA